MTKKTGGFESAVSQLEIIVEKLEEGNLSLEESLALFEKGVRLSADGMKLLDESEVRMNELVTRGISILGESGDAQLGEGEE